MKAPLALCVHTHTHEQANVLDRGSYYKVTPEQTAIHRALTDGVAPTGKAPYKFLLSTFTAISES